MSFLLRPKSLVPPKTPVFVALILAAMAFVAPRTASAQKPKPAPAAARAPAKAASRPAVPATGTAKPDGRGDKQETPVQNVADGDANAPVVSTKEDKEGVKTYNFGAVEVEGRLKSPQLIYFLRRVRAEFTAGELGHRSFLRELSETQRESAFR